MSPRRRHGCGPRHRTDSPADTGLFKVEHRRQAASRRKEATSFRNANPNARMVPDYACGKTRYASAASARTALALIVRYGEGGERVPVRTYPCPACDGWHLTSWPTPNSSALLRSLKPDPS